MFQARKWNWKRVAANLLLVPVLAGGSVAVVQAQLGRGGGAPAMSGMPAMPTTASGGAARSAGPAAMTGDSKQLLKDGRKALAEGRFEAAQDLAMAAEANNSSGKWGLFDDTPAALRKDIQAAMHKAHKAQSEQLVKQAKALATKPYANDAEHAYNLDTAIQMARKAEQLHGPYSAWDWGDRADKLLKDLQEARAKLKVTAAPPAGPSKPPATGHVAGNGTGRTPTGPQASRANPAAPANSAQQAGGFPKAAAGDPRKAAAAKLMAEGKALADQGQFSLAKAKYVEADKLGVRFSPVEPNPGAALQELNTRGAAAMDRLVRDGNAFAAQKDYERAHAALNHAGMIAGVLGLYPKPVTEAKAALWTASGGKYGSAPASGMVAAGGPEHLVPTGGVGATTPPVPAGTQTVYGGGEKSGKPDAARAGGDITGQQLLDQAYVEFKAGEFQTAQRLAVQAHNHGMQKAAAQLLNSIDAEVYARKQRDAERAVANAKAAFDQKDYQRALGALVLIDPKLLPERVQKGRAEMLTACRAELGKSGMGEGVVAAGGVQPPEMGPLPSADQLQGQPKPANPPGTARVRSDDPPSAADALRSVAFQKLRSEGLRVQEESQKAFGRGETDLAMQMLVDYGNRVRGAGLDAGSVSRLLRPIEGRLDTFRMMKAQVDANARLNTEKREAKNIVTSRVAAEEDRKREVAVLMRQCHDLVKKGEYAKAERVALQTKQLDPDEPAVGAMLEMVRLTKRVKDAEAAKSQRENIFLNGMNDAEDMGRLVTTNDPVAVRLDAIQRARGRGPGDLFHQRTRTPAEYEIELKLEKPISVEFNQTPLNQVVENLKTLTGLPLEFDRRSMEDERISEVQLITVKPGTSVAAKNILAFTLEQAGLSYVIEHDLVKITTTKKAKGRMVTKVFSVADLVTPVPNFALPDYANFDKMLNKNPLNSGNLMLSGLNAGGGAAPYTPPGSLGGGQAASTPFPGTLATSPGIHQGGRGGSLETSPLAASTSVTNSNNSKHEQLIKLITSMVRPYSWDGSGGSGKVEFFDIGSALVVNQTADVIQEVQDLLEALRRLQDLAIAVEIRIVSLAESFFERMGVDFSVNIQTHNTQFEPQLSAFNPNTGTNGVFRPFPYLNDLNGYKGITVGLTPAGTFTPDLNVPINATSFQRGIPGYGNYPNSPGNNGGISLGLAFLNDIQVYTFMELAQGDQRSNVMQAPKLTLFNGQTATLTVSNLEFYVTNVQVVSVNGQIVFIPQNTPLPGPGDFTQGGAISITVQAVVSADRRFVRMNLPVTLSAETGAAVPLFPVTTFITPVFEGGSQGQPIPFTQFLQQPAFTTLNISTTVVCPDGGTVLLGGLKTLRESRNEFGPPFLSKIPYLNRLFKNVGVGRDTRHIMIMVTPRIIINSEEEIFQTEGRLPGQGAAGGP